MLLMLSCLFPSIQMKLSKHSSYGSSMLDPRFKPRKCLNMGKYSDQNSTAAILDAKRSAGVAPEVNLRSLLCVGEEVRGTTLTLKPRADITRSPKQKKILLGA